MLMYRLFQKPKNWYEWLYKPISIIWMIFALLNLAMFCYILADTLYPLRGCPWYWVHVVIVNFLILTVVPFIVYCGLGIWMFQWRYEDNIVNLNQVETKADQRLLPIYIALGIGFVFILCLSVVSFAYWILVIEWNVDTIPTIASNVGVSSGKMRADFTIDRDSNLFIPRVTAGSASDAFYSLGWLHAAERYYQMDLNRKTAKGELASLLGSKALQSDIFHRTLGFRRSSERLYQNMSSIGKAALDTYVNGVNDYIASAKTKPHELRTVGYNYETWTAVDTLSILKMHQWRHSGNYLHELMRLRLLVDKGMTPQRVKIIDPPYPLTSGAAFSSFAPTELEESQVNIEPNIAAENISIALEEDRALKLQTWMGKGSSSTGVDIQSLEDLHKGWEPTYTSSGNKLRGASLSVLTFKETTVSQYPVVGVSLKGMLSAPSEYFISQVQFTLDSGSKSFAIGSSIPGIPGFWNARGQSGSWTVTPMGADTTDIYVMNETVKETSYIYKGTVYNYENYNETINVLGGSPVTIKTKNSILGPVLNGGVSNLPGNNYTLVVRWPGFDNDTTMDWLWSSFQTTDFDEFLTLTQTKYHAPAATVVFAGQDSNPVFVQAGRVPRRLDGHTGLFPAVGDGSNDWTGWVTTFGTRRWPSTRFFILGGARLAGRGYRHRLGLDWEDEFIAKRLYDVVKAVIDSGASVKGANIQAAFSEKFDSMFTSFKALLQRLPDSTKKTQLLAWNQLCDGTNTLCGLWRSWYWELSKLGQRAGTGILYYDKPRFLLNALLNDDSSCAPQTCVQFASDALTAASESALSRPITFRHYLQDATPWDCLCNRYTTTYGSSGTVNPLPDRDPTKGSTADQGSAYKHVFDYNDNSFNFQLPLGNTGWQWLRYYWYDTYLSSWTENSFSSMSISYKTAYSQKIYKQ